MNIFVSCSVLNLKGLLTLITLVPVSFIIHSSASLIVLLYYEHWMKDGEKRENICLCNTDLNNIIMQWSKMLTLFLSSHYPGE